MAWNINDDIEELANDCHMVRPKKRISGSRRKDQLHDIEIPTDPEAAIDANQLAVVLGIAPITVTQHRAMGKGPPYFRVGRSVRYRLADVHAWIKAQTVGG